MWAPSICVAERLVCWPQELSLCPVDTVWVESRVACDEFCPVSQSLSLGSGGTGWAPGLGSSGRSPGCVTPPVPLTLYLFPEALGRGSHG